MPTVNIKLGIHSFSAIHVNESIFSKIARKYCCIGMVLKFTRAQINLKAKFAKYVESGRGAVMCNGDLENLR